MWVTKRRLGPSPAAECRGVCLAVNAAYCNTVQPNVKNRNVDPEWWLCYDRGHWVPAEPRSDVWPS
jgi:hypothetical protein